MVKAIGFLLFPGFEVLDVYGPLSIFSSPKLESAYRVITVAATAGPVAGSNGIATVASASFQTCQPLDILVVPGDIMFHIHVCSLFMRLAIMRRHDYFVEVPFSMHISVPMPTPSTVISQITLRRVWLE